MTGTARITLIHTNDLHSHLERWPQMVSVILSEVEAARADGRDAIYLDAGDHMDMSDRTCLGTGGMVNVQLLNQAGCAALTIGNNELLRMKVAELIALAGEAAFPWLAANLRLEGGMPLPTVLDWTMLKVGSVQVGLFGLTAPFPTVGAPLGIEFADTDDTVKRCVGELRAAGADLVVFLSHIGLDEDQRVAALPTIGIDLIVGGHTHNLLEQPDVVAGIPILQTGALGHHVGRIDLDVDLVARRLSRWAGWLIPIDPQRTPANPTVAATLHEAQLDAEAALAEIVTVIPVDLPHNPLGESKLACTLAEVLRQYAQAEIGLVPGVSVAQGLEAGPISRSDLLDAITCLYTPTRLEFTGSHLLGLLEQAEDPVYYTRPLYVGGTRPMGSPLGRIFSSGLSYRYDQTAPVHHRVRDLSINGEPVDPQRIYTVGGPVVLSFGEVGYPSLTGVKVLRRWMPETIRDVFEAALRSGLVLSLTEA